MNIEYTDTPAGREYIDPHGNEIGIATYSNAAGEFVLTIHGSYADGCAAQLTDFRAQSLRPLDQLAYAAHLTATAGGY